MRTAVGVILLFFIPGILLAAQAANLAKPTGIREELINQINDVQEKIVGLAQAFPEEKYNWRPAEGIRSVSEVFVHISGGNFLIPRFAGVEPPPGLTPDMEKTITQKTKVLQLLNQSFEHVRSAINKTGDADLEKRVKFFTGDTSIRDVFMTLIMHMHEHLGQSIAYARINNIVPPWSAAGSRE